MRSTRQLSPDQSSDGNFPLVNVFEYAVGLIRNIWSLSFAKYRPMYSSRIASLCISPLWIRSKAHLPFAIMSCFLGLLWQLYTHP